MKQNMIRYALVVLMSLGGLGCSYSVHQVHVSDSAKSNALSARLVEASREQKVILGFAMEIDYVDEAYAQLQAQCHHGKIQGITTQYSTSHGFLHWTNKILMKGWCLN